MHGIGLQLGVTLPVHVMYGDRTPSYQGMGPNENRTLSFSGQGIGDIGLNLKVRFLDDSTRRPGLALLLTVQFPSGNSEQFLGEGQTTLRPELIVDKTLGRAQRGRIALNVGVLVRPSTHTFTDRGTTFGPTGALVCAPLTSAGVCGTQLSRSLGSQLSYSLGASYAVVPHRVDLIGEIFGAYDVTRSKGGTPVEALAAAKVYLADRSYFEIGASASLLPPNIVDGHGNMTGAPLARVFLGFVFEPAIGDRDHDGFKDDVDPCPDEPETVNGYQDDDGCPDEVPPPPAPAPQPEPEPEPEPAPEPEPTTRVVRVHGQLKTFEKVYFKTASAEILPRSFPLLNDIVTLLQGSSDIRLLEIAGHADERGNDDYNLRLTEARAQSVRKYLVDHGIVADRLIAHGYGEQQPARDEQTLRPCTAHTERCWDMNRRVEFRILQN
jgi:large repetitive protein